MLVWMVFKAATMHQTFKFVHAKQINGLLNCFRTINLHAVGAFIVINMREGGFVKSTDKLFGTLEIFMEICRLKLYILAVYDTIKMESSTKLQYLN